MAELLAIILASILAGVLVHRVVAVIWYGLDALALYLKARRDVLHNVAKMAERDRR